MRLFELSCAGPITLQIKWKTIEMCNLNMQFDIVYNTINICRYTYFIITIYNITHHHINIVYKTIKRETVQHTQLKYLLHSL